ncbi:MAG TPA: hypothetical protein DDY31_16320 [Lachnospiraceae bacterium]|nr:hypothetical protein [Lachnospiraceae bacterium]
MALNEQFRQRRSTEMFTQQVAPQCQQERQFLRNQEDLNYAYAKGQLDLQKQQLSLAQRLEFEEKKKQLQISYNAYMQLIFSTVYKNSDGQLMYAISDSEGKNIRSKPLLNIRGYEAILYLSYFSEAYAVLEISWGEQSDQNSVCFLYNKEGISPDTFLKKLKSHGILMLVSGSAEKEAAKALLAYSIENVEEVELPFAYGWNMYGNGAWHFATEDELTMLEVLKNV